MRPGACYLVVAGPASVDQTAWPREDHRLLQFTLQGHGPLLLLGYPVVPRENGRGARGAGWGAEETCALTHSLNVAGIGCSEDKPVLKLG